VLPSGDFYVQNELKLTYGRKNCLRSLALAMLALPEIFS
jgi:hypothetical protein